MSKSYWNGELIRTGPDTWEVRHPVSQGEKQKTAAGRNRAAGKIPPANKRKVVYEYFWNARRKAIVDRQGKTVVKDVEITSTRQDADFTQVFIRFRMDGKEYTARTIKGEKNALAIRGGRKKVNICACGKLLKSDSTTGMCQKCRSASVVKAKKACTVCGKTLRDQNVTSLCVKHYRESQHAADQKRGFNPFLAS